MLKKIFAITLMVSLTTPALAEDNWLSKAQDINKQEIAKQDSAAKQHFFKTGKLAQGKTLSLPIQLKEGKFYAFMADCDYECNEASLTLSQNGKQLAAMHESGNSSPMFGYQAKQSGTYHLNYTINECEKATCDYSAEVFEGNKVYKVDF
ncbi:MAG: hypothetical protein Q4B82_04160 [Alysiella sp.]|uniref:hypothetical protein n=1 Tax=Alysiella sp. TaxID=1872483 RepID=UPI0026DC93D9|nr:hypothetical protein [Alysiella sp.]MDO4433755.1 hypothetical protein [Alysiella sp.]